MIDHFRTTRALTDALTAPLSAEDQTVQSMPDVSPTKWHRAHTTWFFETFVLERWAPEHEPFDPAYRELFNSYYEGIGPQFSRARRGLLSRPGVDEIARYRRHVDDAVADVVGRASGEDRDLFELIELGVHHEQQHQELLLMDIEHVLSINPTGPVYRRDAGARAHASEPIEWLDVEPPDLVDIGHDGRRFAFDSEGPRHRAHLGPYRIADRLVTAGEWKAFMDDGGYERAELWLSDGWHTARQEGWQAPLYWRRDGDDWLVHTLGGTRPVADGDPVCHVSHYEADAYARWAEARLPTEFEWEHAVATLPVAPPRSFDLDALHPRAPQSAGCGTLAQVFGECWQWTASAYLPYPGFTAPAGAIGEYNGKFMSGQMVLRGSSSYTPPGHARATYRNFFPPQRRWMQSGVRLADGGRS